jgi:hypothetical protein
VSLVRDVLPVSSAEVDSYYGRLADADAVLAG